MRSTKSYRTPTLFWNIINFDACYDCFSEIPCVIPLLPLSPGERQIWPCKCTFPQRHTPCARRLGLSGKVLFRLSKLRNWNLGFLCARNLVLKLISWWVSSLFSFEKLLPLSNNLTTEFSRLVGAGEEPGERYSARQWEIVGEGEARECAGAREHPATAQLWLRFAKNYAPKSPRNWHPRCIFPRGTRIRRENHVVDGDFSSNSRFSRKFTEKMNPRAQFER